MSDKKYRLVTRSDFDGLACAVLLNELGMIDDIKFVHPKDMQDGKVEIRARHHHQPALCSRRASGLRPPRFRDLPQARRAAQPHHLSRCALGGARGVRHFGGKSRFPRPR
jgi:hypothetical protein